MSAEAADPLVMLSQAVNLAPVSEAGGAALARLACDLTRPGAPLVSPPAAAVVLASYARRWGHRGGLGDIAARLLPILENRPGPELGALFAGAEDDDG